MQVYGTVLGQLSLSEDGTGPSLSTASAKGVSPWKLLESYFFGTWRPKTLQVSSKLRPGLK